MTSVIVVFSKPKNVENMKSILMWNGFSVVTVCTSGVQALNCMDGLDDGVPVSDYRLESMLYQELRECLSVGFEMLLIVSSARFFGGLPEDLVYLPMPSKVHDLMNTLEMMAQARAKRKRKSRQKPKERDEGGWQLIIRAKGLLVEWNNMTEIEARRYIRKYSMDGGANMVETAQMVTSLIHL